MRITVNKPKGVVSLPSLSAGPFSDLGLSSVVLQQFVQKAKQLQIHVAEVVLAQYVGLLDKTMLRQSEGTRPTTD